MFSWLHRRVTFANVAMTFALIFAMTGGAYAAKHYVIESTKQINPKVIAALKGKAGAKGTNGVNGKDGANGVNGKDGANGVNGINGKDGSPGSQGTTGPSGATGAKGATGATGPAGPSGPSGPKGATGEPWVPNNLLPKGASETGTWGVAALPGRFVLIPEVFEPEWTFASISFTVKLAHALAPAHVFVIAQGGHGAGVKTCPVSANVEKPEAEEGNLCIFQGEPEINVGSIEAYDPATKNTGEAMSTGALVELRPANEKSPIDAYGSWAVEGE